MRFKENMQSCMILENLFFIFLVLFVATGINSQTTSDDWQQPNRFRSCGAASYCIPIRRCSSLRDGWKRRGVGITCGYGIGPYRMVCCPRGTSHSTAEEVQVRQTKRTTTTTPLPPPRSGSSGDCGLSQDIDWFQEHADDVDALEATWPWMVAIRMQATSGLFLPWCSGFLIDKTHVLSAAHCFEYNRDVGRYSARIGSDDQNSAEEYPITEIKQHEDYKPGQYYDDIAILTLGREVNSSNFVPLCLPNEKISEMDLTGWGTTLLGWGSERLNGRIGNSLKQLDNVPIVSVKECSQILRELLRSFRRQFPRDLTKKMLCAGQTEGARDACGGYSGGPMMLLYRKRWFAVGIISFGYGCGQPGVPSGLTRISSYLDWIRQNTENGSYPILAEL